jgi:hypothetical protein
MVPEWEYEIFYAKSFDWSFSQDSYWYLTRQYIKDRSDPMPETAEWLLNLLNEWEGEAPTHIEIHHRCGDGRELREISENLHWLERRKYVTGGVIRPCKLAQYGYSVPWSITQAGREYLVREEHQ